MNTHTSVGEARANGSRKGAPALAKPRHLVAALRHRGVL